MVKLFFLFSFFPLGNQDVIQEVEDIHQHCYRLLNSDPDSALVLTDRALLMAQDIDYVWGEANSYYIKGYIFHKLENKSVAALLMYMRAGKLLEQGGHIKETRTLADVYINAGSILRIHGKMDEAIKLYDKALDELGKYDEKERELLILFNKAYALHDKQNFDETTTVLIQCINLARTLNNNVQLNNSWNLLGDTMLKAGRDEEAKKCFYRVIENEEGNGDARANSANNLADFYFSISSLDSAKFYYQLAINFGKDLSIPVILFYSYSGLSNCYLLENDVINGIAAGEKAISLYDSIVPEAEHFMIFDILADLYAKNGDHEMSHDYSKRYVAETAKYFDRQKDLIEIKNEFQMDLLLAGFYTEMELESRGEEYTKVLISSGTILIGLILLLFIQYRRKLKSNYQDILDIIEDVK